MSFKLTILLFSILALFLIATSLSVFTREDLFDNNLESTDDTFKAILKDQEFEMHFKNKISTKDIESFVSDSSIGTIFYPVVEGMSKSKIIRRENSLP